MPPPQQKPPFYNWAGRCVSWLFVIGYLAGLVTTTSTFTHDGIHKHGNQRPVIHNQCMQQRGCDLDGGLNDCDDGMSQLMRGQYEQMHDGDSHKVNEQQGANGPRIVTCPPIATRHERETHVYSNHTTDNHRCVDKRENVHNLLYVNVNGQTSPYYSSWASWAFGAQPTCCGFCWGPSPTSSGLSSCGDDNGECHENQFKQISPQCQYDACHTVGPAHGACDPSYRPVTAGAFAGDHFDIQTTDCLDNLPLCDDETIDNNDGSRCKDTDRDSECRILAAS